MAGPIRISILANSGQATAQLKATENAVGRVGARMTKLRVPAAAVAAGFVALGGGLLSLAKGAAEDDKAQTILAKTLRNTAGATDAQVKAVEDYISKTGAATGVTDDEMRPALANLARATKDVGKAQTLLGLAMDISAGTGKDLGAVSLALAKAQNGQVGGLQKLGIQTKDASGKTKTFTQLQADLAKTFGGQSAAAAETAAGKFARVKLQLSETGEALGAKLLPAMLAVGNLLLTKFVPGLEKTIAFAERNKTTLAVLAAIIGTLAGAILLVNAAMAAWTVVTKIQMAVQKIATAVQWAWNAALLANPVVLIVAGIVLLIGVIVLVATKTKFFQTVWAAAWGGIKAVAGAVVNWFKGPFVGFFSGALAKITGAAQGVFSWIKRNWPLLLGILTGPIGLAVVAIVKNWDRIRSSAVTAFNAVVSFVKGIPGRILGALGNIGKLLYGVGKSLIQGMINGIRDMVGSLVGSVKNAISSIPGTAKKLLGIGSPSKLFRGFGRNTIRGYIEGLQLERRRLARSMAQTLQFTDGTVTPRPSVALAGGGTLLAAPAAAPVQINVSVLTGGPEAGRAVVRAIKAYEAERGDRWRR